MARGGAPAGNGNAVSHGLHSSHPARRVEVQPSVTFAEMATFADTLADASIDIADSLAARLDVAHKDAKLVGLYAAVGQEMAQLAGELLGETGIKPAALGRLSEEQFAALMRKEAKALSLLLSQINTAWSRLKTVEELGVEARPDVIDLGRGLIRVDGTVNPVLDHLAAHIRAAKRIMRDMAANRAWEQRGALEEDDLAARLLRQLEEE